MNSKYICNNCQYYTNKKGDYTKHLNTKKHNKNSEKEKEKSIITELLNQNKDLIFQNKELQKLIIEKLNTPQIINNNNSINTNCNNKNSFNLNVFLNEKCKDAMNIGDFIQNIKISLKQLEDVGEYGFVKGLSDIFISELKKLDIYKRPIHCSDFKRETFYIKDNDKWDKERKEREKLNNMIDVVSKKNINKITDWTEEYPECNDPKSKKNDKYLKIVNGSMEVITDNKKNKIISNISKHITIEK